MLLFSLTLSLQLAAGPTPSCASADSAPRRGDTVTAITDTTGAATTGATTTGAATAGPLTTMPLGAVQPAGLTTRQDTVPRRRAKAVSYSDGYGKRLAIHRTLSWAMLPLFAVSYVSGEQLIDKGSDAPAWARNVHPVAATGSAVLFGANAITGTWNLWEGRRDPNGRVKRFVHGALFLAASGGFAYTGTKLAEDAQESQSKRQAHRNGALVSMGVSTASWLIMLVGR